MAARRPYERPMGRWWARNPSFLRYFARELTSVFVALYAVLLLAGLVRLAQGEAAFAAWLAFLRSPISLAVHAVLFLAFVYHAWSWFAIMPKTMAPLAVAGRRVPPWAITASGLAAAVACSAFLLLLLGRLAA